MSEDMRRPHEQEPLSFAAVHSMFAQAAVARKAGDISQAQQFRTYALATFEGMDYDGLRDLFAEASMTYRANENPETTAPENFDPSIRTAWTSLYSFLNERFPEACANGGELDTINKQTLIEQAARSAEARYGPPE